MAGMTKLIEWDEPELKCCPFCKSNDVRIWGTGVKGFEWSWEIDYNRIDCKKCWVSIDLEVPAQEVINAWNRRDGENDENCPFCNRSDYGWAGAGAAEIDSNWIQCHCGAVTDNFPTENGAWRAWYRRE